MKRSDVVTVDFSRYDPANKVRPALVVQNDRDNARMNKTVVALISTTVRQEDTQYPIERGDPNFPATGLYRDSAVNCSNLYTIRQSDISRVIGRITPATMDRVDACLKVALGLRRGICVLATGARRASRCVQASFGAGLVGMRGSAECRVSYIQHSVPILLSAEAARCSCSWGRAGRRGAPSAGRRR